MSTCQGMALYEMLSNRCARINWVLGTLLGRLEGQDRLRGLEAGMGTAFRDPDTSHQEVQACSLFTFHFFVLF